MTSPESSAQIIKRTLIDALENRQRPLTVSTLCRLSGVARATFYLHFKSIDEVFMAVVDDIFDEAERKMAASSSTADTVALAKQQVSVTLKHRAVLLAMFDLGMLDIVTRRSRQTIRQFLLMVAPELKKIVDEDHFEDALSFVVGGSALLMETWLRAGKGIEPENRLVTQLVEMTQAALEQGLSGPSGGQ